MTTDVAAPAPRTEPFAFTGSGRDYFPIWLTNVVFSVATLGIYSAWAKARRLRYFYRHTRLAGAGFDYHGRPAALLKGRVVAVALFGLYSLAGYVSPWLTLASVAGLATVLPWLAARSFRFRCRNTSHRGVRFNFNGSMRSAYGGFLGLPALALVSLGLMVPFWHHRLKRYQHGHSAYGRSAFGFFGDADPFYAIYFSASLLTIGLGIALVVGLGLAGSLVTLALTGSANPTRVEPGSAAWVIVFSLAIVGYLAVITAVQAFLAARIGRHVWAHTTLGRTRFVWRIEAPRLFVIRLTNLLLTVVTLGLYRPFAQVRLARYLTEAFVVVGAGGLDAFEALPAGDVGAYGDEAMEFLDFDIGF
ncbi:MAG: YjgN family protein [Vicinamibacterales bacterium]